MRDGELAGYAARLDRRQQQLEQREAALQEGHQDVASREHALVQDRAQLQQQQVRGARCGFQCGCGCDAAESLQRTVASCNRAC